MTRIAFERAFQELTDAEVETVMARAAPIEYPAETILMHEGENQDRILVILKGETRVVRLGRDGKETQLADPLGPGDTVGEMSFIDDMGASATLIARNDVTVMAIDKPIIDAMMAADPTFAGRFYHSLLFTVIRRLRVLDYRMAFPDWANTATRIVTEFDRNTIIKQGNAP